MIFSVNLTKIGKSTEPNTDALVLSFPSKAKLVNNKIISKYSMTIELSIPNRLLIMIARPPTPPGTIWFDTMNMLYAIEIIKHPIINSNIRI